MRAVHLTAKIAGRKSAGVVVIGSNIGVQDWAKRYADVGAEGIGGNAELLAKLADLAEKYYKKK